jgi:SPX domain protein involved in polyphosphate accumulation
MLKRGEIERRIESCHVHQDKSILHTISVDIHYLYHFAKLNYCGFILLFMQFHQLFGSPVHNTLEKRISNNSSIYNDSIALFRLAVQTNSLYQNIHLKSPYFHPKRSHVAFQQETTHINNQVGNCNLSASSYPSSIDSCETAHSDQDEEPSNTVKKYWIHPDNVLELILHLSSNMVIQDRHASHITAVDQVGHPESDKSNAINKVTTVYLDTPQFDGYAGLMRNEATSVTRIRWYNEGNTPKSYVELEKKAYARTEDSFAQKQLIQQRVWLKSKRLQSWLNGNYSIGCPFSKDSCQYRTNGTLTWRETDKQRMLETCLQIENQVHSKHQVPGKFLSYVC